MIAGRVHMWRCRLLAETNLVQAIRIRALEGMIRRLMDAMKPLLDEWHSIIKTKSPLFLVTYVLSGWGIEPGFVVFGIKRVEEK